MSGAMRKQPRAPLSIHPIGQAPSSVVVLGQGLVVVIGQGLDVVLGHGLDVVLGQGLD